MKKGVTEPVLKASSVQVDGLCDGVCGCEAIKCNMQNNYAHFIDVTC
jgi:hypothetical protein